MYFAVNSEGRAMRRYGLTPALGLELKLMINMYDYEVRKAALCAVRCLD
jgi:hypothetical protein